MMEHCQKCGSEQFYEEDGFQFCSHCQTQSQGFAKEVAADEYPEEIRHKEIRINKQSNDRRKTNQTKNLNKIGIHSTWNTFEAFNSIYIEFIKDFFQIIHLNGLPFSNEMKQRFISVSMQLWFKYLRESDIAFAVDEHMEKRIRLHPLTRYRDNYLLANPSLLNQDDDDNQFILPYSRHKTINQPRDDNFQLSFGNRYRCKYKNIKMNENDKYFDENDPDKCGDPRYQMRIIKGPYKRDKAVKANKLLVTEAVSATNFVDNSNAFINFINDYLSSGGSLPKQVTPTNIDSDDADNNDDNEPELLMDEEQFKRLKFKHMSNKSKYLEKHLSFDACNVGTRHSSPFSNEVISKYKILVFLYLAIRLFNFNIYLTDLIRWCNAGSIRFANLFENFLDKQETILSMDVLTFVDYKYPDYRKIVRIMRNMIIHLNLDYSIIPKPNLYCLIKRYLYDLNLPDGLLLLIRYRYERFIDYYSNESLTDNINGKSISPCYDIVCIVSIILILRDLFNFNGSTELNYFHNQSFRHTRFEDKLFNWNQWLHYSRIRFNLIRSFRMNIRIDNLDIIDINDTLSNLYRMTEFFRDVKIARKVQAKQYCWPTRFNLQESFEKAIFTQNNFEWKDRIKQQPKSIPSFYPLTTSTAEILEQIRNNDIKNILQQNFRQKLITPYVCDHNFNNFHRQRSTRLFGGTFQISRIRLLLSDTTRFLLDLATFITCVDIYPYLPFLRTAEKFDRQPNNLI